MVSKLLWFERVWNYTKKSDKKVFCRFTQKLYLRVQKYFGFGLWVTKLLHIYIRVFEEKKVEICVSVIN